MYPLPGGCRRRRRRCCWTVPLMFRGLRELMLCLTFEVSVPSRGCVQLCVHALCGIGERCSTQLPATMHSLDRPCLLVLCSRHLLCRHGGLLRRRHQLLVVSLAAAGRGGGPLPCACPLVCSRGGQGRAAGCGGEGWGGWARRGGGTVRRRAGGDPGAPSLCQCRRPRLLSRPPARVGWGSTRPGMKGFKPLNVGSKFRCLTTTFFRVLSSPAQLCR